MHNIKCNLPLIGNVSIKIIDKNLYNFTKRQFKNYIVSESKTSSGSRDFISINTENFNNLNFDDIILGRNIKFKSNKLKVIKKSRVQNITYKYDFNDSLSLTIDLKKKSLFYLKNLIESEYSITHGLFYETILYPIFSFYALKSNYSLIHGSLLKFNNKYIVLTGLDGVGKSSLSNELVLKGAKILADNFVLYNGGNFIGLNMPIRIDLENDTKENVIFEDNNLKEILYEYCEDTPVKVEQVYFLSIAEKFNIENIDINIVNQNWNLINNGASEILGANVFNIPFLYQNSLSKTIDNSNLKYYSFSIPKGKINKATKEFICQLNI
jgi:hypothetical protein